MAAPVSCIVMAYSLSLRLVPLPIFEPAVQPLYSCHQAQKACMPSFVFSVSGQVNFREALHHLLSCQSRMCASLRKKVRQGMEEKLGWLWQEEALLGCIYVQPLLYRMAAVVDLGKKENFGAVAKHLSRCPQESCARLRRSLLLSIRDHVSPAALRNQLPAA